MGVEFGTLIGCGLGVLLTIIVDLRTFLNVLISLSIQPILPDTFPSHVNLSLNTKRDCLCSHAVYRCAHARNNCASAPHNGPLHENIPIKHFSYEFGTPLSVTDTWGVRIKHRRTSDDVMGSQPDHTR